MKRFLLFPLIIILITQTACWNRKELNTLGIVGAVAIDKKDGIYDLTFEVVKSSSVKSGSSSGGEEKGGKTVFVKGTGASTFEAIRNTTLSFDRKLFFPHCREYIFSEDTAREGLMDIIDFWERDHETRRTPYIVIAQGAEASDLLGVTGGVEEMGSVYLERIIENQPVNSKTVKTPIREFLKAYYEEGGQPIAVGAVKRKKAEKIGKSENEYVLVPEGAAVFNEGKLLGFLDGDQTMGMNFVMNNIKSGAIVESTPGYKGIDSEEIIKSKTKNDVTLNENGMQINVKVDIQAMLAEVNTSVNLKEPSGIEKIQKQMNEVVKEKIKNSVEYVQKQYKIDVFGFEAIYKGGHYSEWRTVKEDWDRLFSNAKISVNVNTVISRRGLTNNPVMKKELQ